MSAAACAGALIPLDVHRELAAARARVRETERRLADIARALRASEEKVFRLAHLDGLTGLPNRRVLREQLGAALAQARRGEPGCALLLLDLDAFKRINESLGHEAGDRVLVEMAQRLKSCLRPQDTLARLGSDEFAILAPGVADRDSAAALAGRALAAVRPAFQARRKELRLGAAVGIAMGPGDGPQPGALLRAADAAMHRAKEERHDYCFFAAPMFRAATQRLSLEAELARALERHEFAYHYQPKLDLATGRITGVEALLRWHHPQRGLVMPGEFIEVVDEMSMTASLTWRALECACAQLVEWDREGVHVGSIALNLTARQLGDPVLGETVSSVLQAHALGAERLQLEITETAMLQFEGCTANNLDRLARLGIVIALDDFGTGYSNLAYLKRLPIGQLKVDRSFVMDLGAPRDSRPLVAAIATMACSLGMRVVAEGVETREQLQIVRALGCNEVQGFLVSAPLAAPELAQYLRARAAQNDAGADRIGTPADRPGRP